MKSQTRHPNRFVLHPFLLASLLWLIAAFASHAQASPATLNNQAALKGLSEIYALYDIRKSNPDVMLSYLKGIESNHANLLKEKVTPHLRIIFISAAVQFITTDPADAIEIEHGDTLKKIAAQVARLQALGVQMEVCSTATAYFKVDNATLLPGIVPVRSGFLSVMGWQAQGYSLVPVY